MTNDHWAHTSLHALFFIMVSNGKIDKVAEWLNDVDIFEIKWDYPGEKKLTEMLLNFS